MSALVIPLYAERQVVRVLATGEDGLVSRWIIEDGRVRYRVCLPDKDGVWYDEQDLTHPQ